MLAGNFYMKALVHEIIETALGMAILNGDDMYATNLNLY